MCIAVHDTVHVLAASTCFTPAFMRLQEVADVVNLLEQGPAADSAQGRRARLESWQDRLEATQVGGGGDGGRGRTCKGGRQIRQAGSCGHAQGPVRCRVGT